MENKEKLQFVNLLDAAKKINFSSQDRELISAVFNRNPDYFGRLKLSNLKDASIVHSHNLENELGRLDLQATKRKEGIENGMNPDYIIAISDNEVIDLYALMQLFEFGGAISIASALDDFMYDYLRLYALNDSGDDSIFSSLELSNTTNSVRRLRDAILFGLGSNYMSCVDNGARYRGEEWS